MTIAKRARSLAATLAVVCTVLLPAAAQDGQRRVTDASWSPDGAHAVLLFSVSGAGPAGSEALVVQGSGQARRVPLGPGFARFLGWSPDGSSFVLETGPGELSVQPVEGGEAAPLRLPRGAVPLASDGERVFFLSEDRGHLLSLEAGGQTRVVTSLPSGVRPPGCLSPDGRRLALRRAVPAEGRAERWATEILVVEGGRARPAATIPSATVRVSWHASRGDMLVSIPSRDGWVGRVLRRRGPQWEVHALYPDLPSPLQWDRSGRLYAADAQGLLDVVRGRRVRGWGGRLMLWALSPEGQQVLAGLEEAGEETAVMLLPLPGGQGRQVGARSRPLAGRP